MINKCILSDPNDNPCTGDGSGGSSPGKGGGRQKRDLTEIIGGDLPQSKDIDETRASKVTRDTVARELKSRDRRDGDAALQPGIGKSFFGTYCSI